MDAFLRNISYLTPKKTPKNACFFAQKHSQNRLPDSRKFSFFFSEMNQSEFYINDF